MLDGAALFSIVEGEMPMGIYKERGREWTQAEIDGLNIYWALGWPARKIADKLGRSRNSVIGKADRLRLPQHSDARVASMQEPLNAR